MSEKINKNTEDQVSRNLQVVVFKLGGEEYGLLIDQIKEVVITPSITKMPQMPPHVKGVANIRGNVIAIFDLCVRFNLKLENEEQSNKYTLVVESDDVKVGLLVNDVPNTVSVSSSSLDESVSIVGDAHSDSNYIRGIIKNNDKLIILIDIFKVIEYDMSALKRSQIAA